MNFIIGCNYWASHAGTEMWRQWDESVIRKDLKILTENGIRFLRVFPNWRDFQPIVPVLAGKCNLQGYLLEGDRDPENPYWLDETMLERFATFCDICEEYHLKLIIGLLTGFMSGRVFVPPALYQRELLTDATAILFEQRLIKGIVQRMREKEAIYAWDIGNECLGMGNVSDVYTATNWTATMANAIRAYDKSRPVISGCHRMAADEMSFPWTIAGEAESCDILVSHPYPMWSKYGYKEYTASYRTVIHGTCEAKFYADLGHKPCLIEEIGTMGPMICDERVASDFMRVNLFSAWANGLLGVMWWCACEQVNLKTIPYTTNMCEIELGMLDKTGLPKPVLLETKRMGQVFDRFDFELPKAEEDAVCILTQSQDQWGTAFMTYGIAKQAGINLKFAYCKEELPKSDIYLVPSICGNSIMPRENYLELKKRIFDGATLYLSNDNGILAEFEELSGMRVVDSGRFYDNLIMKTETYEIEFQRSVRYNLQPVSAEVLAYDSIGLPAVTVNRYGKGKVYYVNFPLESMLLEENAAFDKEYYKLYKQIFAEKIDNHSIRCENPAVSITYHKGKSGEEYVVAINYSSERQEVNLVLSQEATISEVLYGNTDRLEPFEACVLKMT